MSKGHCRGRESIPSQGHSACTGPEAEQDVEGKGWEKGTGVAKIWTMSTQSPKNKDMEALTGHIAQTLWTKVQNISAIPKTVAR